MMVNQIPKIVLFARSTEGEALEIANNTVDKKMAIAEVILMRGFKPAEKAVCWIPLEYSALKRLIEGKPSRES